MKKGFTLIELLVVIILIAAIVLLALPKITDSVKNNSANVDKTTFNIIKEATKLYVSDNPNSFMKRSENTYCVSLNELIEKKYLKNTIEYNNQDITNTKVMKVTYENGFNYELVDKNSCQRVVKFNTVCEADKEQLYATNALDIGYKYNCKVDPNRARYNFYVLSYNDENGNIIFDKANAKSVNLIMDQNINSDGSPAGMTEITKNDDNAYNIVAWTNKDDYGTTLYPADYIFCYEEGGCAGSDKGPLTAMNFLNEATKTWTNINEMVVDTFIDDTGATHNMKAYNTYARMPIYLSDATKTEVADETDANRYLIDNLSFAYWTATAYSTTAAIIVCGGPLGVIEVGRDGDYGAGVRPVITFDL